MSIFIESFKRSLLTPIKGFKKKYIPLLLIYFAYGSQSFITITSTFWEKENLTLSAEELLVIGFWVMMPWTMKILVGPLVDSVKILGSKRRSYIFIGAILIALQFVILAGMGGEYAWIMDLGMSQYQLYLFAAILGAFGFMIQDVTADAMSTEVVDRRGKSETEIKTELGLVQVLGRLSLYGAMMAVAGISGWMASIYDFETMMWISLWIPLVSVLGAIFIKLDLSTNEKPKLDYTIWGGGIVYVIFSAWMAFAEIPNGQEINFFVSFVVLGLLMIRLLKELGKAKMKMALLTFFVIFVYRAIPTTGPGFSWWAIDELGFDPQFFGVLQQTAAIIGVLALWLMADWMIKRSIKKIFIILTVLWAILSLPEIMLFYGIHETLGLSAKFVALIDTAAESPLTNLAMIPMLSLIAYYAPAHSRATWFAVAASMMNLSMMVSKLGTKYLNEIFVITREVRDEVGNIVTAANYSQLGDLMIIKTLWGFVVPMAVILLFFKPPKKS